MDIPPPRIYFTDLDWAIARERITDDMGTLEVVKIVLDKRFPDRCPVCCNDFLEHGERVHNGVGLQQVTPDFCEVCGYVQPGANTPDSALTPNQIAYLWEMQVGPHA